MRLLILIPLLSIVAMAQCTSPCVAHVSVTGDTTSGSPINTTGANLLVVVLANFGASAVTGITVSDNKGNSTWAVCGLNATAGNANTAIWYQKNPTVGTGHTFTVSGDSFGTIQAAAFSGADTTAPCDHTNQSGATGATTVQAGSITPTSPNKIVFAVVGTDSHAGTSWTIGSSYSIIDNNAGGGNMQMADAFFTTTSATNPLWTYGTSISMSANIASFKAASAGATIKRRILQ